MDGRIAAPTQEEMATAVHEAAHAVIAQLLPGMNHTGAIRTWATSDGWAGFVAPNGTEFNPPYDPNADEGFPPHDATMPIQWREECRTAWSELCHVLAGAAAESIFYGDPLDAGSIRSYWSAVVDNKIAYKLCRHFFQAEFTDALLDRAAETAVLLCQTPVIWAAIEDVARFLTDHGRGKASVFEVSAIIRQHAPQPFTEAPGWDRAAAFIRRQP